MFEIPGPPKGKGRPRFNSNTQRAYTPEGTSNYEELVRWSFRTSKDFYKLEGPIKATIIAYFPVPKSTTKKDREAMLEGRLFPTKKPDADNILKIVLDALNKLAYEDDSQVTEVHFFKFYGDEPKVLVDLTKVNEVCKSE